MRRRHAERTRRPADGHHASAGRRWAETEAPRHGGEIERAGLWWKVERQLVQELLRLDPQSIPKALDSIVFVVSLLTCELTQDFADVD